MRLALLVGWGLLACAFGDALGQAPSATAVRGVVFDSLTFRGLSGATVQLMALVEPAAQSTVRSARTNERGQFEFTDVPQGRYLIGFFHQKLDSLEMTGPTKRLDITGPKPVTTELSIPAGRTIARTVCGADFPTEEVGLLVGRVRGAGDTKPRAGAKVEVSWADVIVEKGEIKRQIATAQAVTSPGGQFAICGVPLMVGIIVHASTASDSSGQFELTLPRTFVSRDIYVGPVSRVLVESADSTPDAEWLRGSGKVRGRVVASNERPVRNARVTVAGSGVETTTNANGEFSLENLPPGTHSLEVRAIGFSPARAAVDILEEQASAQVELAALAITIDTVRVTAQRVFTSPRLMEVVRRQRSGMGQVLIAEEIDKRNAWRVSDLLRTMRGIRIAPGRYGSDAVLMRDKLGNGYCTPTFVIDNMPMLVSDFFPIDNVVPLDNIVAVEVYSTIVPADFFARPNCGVVSITTGYRPRQESR